MREKEKKKEREKDKEQAKEKDKEREKKKHKLMNEIKQENGEAKPLLKGEPRARGQRYTHMHTHTPGVQIYMGVNLSVERVRDVSDLLKVRRC